MPSHIERKTQYIAVQNAIVGAISQQNAYIKCIIYFLLWIIVFDVGARALHRLSVISVTSIVNTQQNGTTANAKWVAIAKCAPHETPSPSSTGPAPVPSDTFIYIYIYIRSYQHNTLIQSRKHLWICTWTLDGIKLDCSGSKPYFPLGLRGSKMDGGTGR